MDTREARGVSSLKADQPRMNRRCTPRCDQSRSTSDTSIVEIMVSMCYLRGGGRGGGPRQSNKKQVCALFEQRTQDHVMQCFHNRQACRQGVATDPCPAHRIAMLTLRASIMCLERKGNSLWSAA